MKKSIYLTILTIATVICILAGAVTHLTSFGSIFTTSLTERNAETIFDESIAGSDPTQLKTIEINSDVMDVDITEGAAFRMVWYGSEKLKPSLAQDGTTLTISQKGTFRPRFSLGIRNSGSHLKLELPEGYAPELLSCGSDVGDIRVSGVTLQESRLTLHVGDLTMQNADLGAASASLDTGDITIKDCTFADLTVVNNVGDIEISAAHSLADYTLDLSNDIGEIELNDTDLTHTYTRAGSGYTLKVKNHIGDIEIEGEGF